MRACSDVGVGYLTLRTIRSVRSVSACLPVIRGISTDPPINSFHAVASTKDLVLNASELIPDVFHLPQLSLQIHPIS